VVRSARLRIASAVLLTTVILVAAAMEWSVVPSRAQHSGFAFAPSEVSDGPWGDSAQILPLVPSPVANRNCAVGSSTHPDSTIDLRYGQVQSNLYNLQSGSSGNLTTCLGAGGNSLSATANFSDSILSNPRFPIVGFSNLAYGVCPWNGSPDGPSTSSLDLPMPSSEIARLWGVSDYAITPQGSGSYDFVYDLWLTPHAPVRGGACAPSPSYVSLEVMVWNYWQSLVPAGEPLTDWGLPTIVDGTLAERAWVVYAYCDPQEGIDSIAFLSSSPEPLASEGVPLSLFVEEAEVEAEATCSGTLAFGSYWLDVISIGAEFGPPRNPGGPTDGGPARLTWSLASYCLEIGQWSWVASALACQASLLPPGTGWSQALTLLSIVSGIAVVTGTLVYRRIRGYRQPSA
jgi:hypothetical protein